MGKVTFEAVIHITGVNPHVTVSPELVATLRPGWRRPLPVRVRIGGGPEVPWRTNLMPTGDGSFLLYLHVAMRRAAHAEVGDTVAVELALDLDYETHPDHVVPEWLEVALDGDVLARRNWERLPFSRRKEVTRYLRALRSAEARERNLAIALRALRGESVRFLGRTWTDGR